MGEDDSLPLVSVVIPTYDRPNMLFQAITSVRAQRYPHIEVLVIDDASPTPAAQAIATEDASGMTIRCIRHETNQGANIARKTGITEATGEFIAFLDDDDRWHPDKLAKQVNEFAADERIGVVYTGQAYVNEAGATTTISTPTTSGDATEAILRGASVGPFSTLMVRASVIDEAGPPDERFPSWQDREWILRLSEQCLLKPVAEPLTIRTMDSHSQISDQYRKKRDVSYPLFIETHRERAASFGRSTERAFLADRALVLAAAALEAGYDRDARQLALRAVRLWPTRPRGYLYLSLALGGQFLYRKAQRTKRAVSTADI